MSKFNLIKDEEEVMRILESGFNIFYEPKSLRESIKNENIKVFENTIDFIDFCYNFDYMSKGDLIALIKSILSSLTNVKDEEVSSSFLNSYQFMKKVKFGNYGKFIDYDLFSEIRIIYVEDFHELKLDYRRFLSPSREEKFNNLNENDRKELIEELDKMCKEYDFYSIKSIIFKIEKVFDKFIEKKNKMKIIPNYTTCLYNGKLCVVMGNDRENSEEDLTNLNYYIKFGESKEDILLNETIAKFNGDTSYHYYDEMVLWSELEVIDDNKKISKKDIEKHIRIFY